MYYLFAEAMKVPDDVDQANVLEHSEVGISVVGIQDSGPIQFQLLTLIFFICSRKQIYYLFAKGWRFLMTLTKRTSLKTPR